MADIRQNTDVTGKLTVEGGGASHPFEVKGSSDSGVSSYTQLKLTDQNTGALLQLFNQAGQTVFQINTDSTNIGGSYNLPHDAPSVGQVLTRASGAGVGEVTWEDNVADAGTIGGEPVSLSTLQNNNLLQYDGTSWVNVAPVTPVTPTIDAVTTAGNTTTNDVTFGSITIDEVSYDGADGLAGQVLTTDGSGTLTFEDAAIDLVAIDVHNDSGSTIARGLPVVITGTHASGKPTVGLADNNANDGLPCIGLVEASITNNTDGTVIVSGMMRNVNTSSYTAGDALYIDSTAGALTTTRPVAVSSGVQKIGVVTRSHASTGEILVMGAGRANDIPNDVDINDLANVDTAGYEDGDVLVWRTLDDAWVPEALPSSGATELDELSDVTIDTGADGEVLAHDGTGFVNSSLATEVGAHVDISDLADVTDSAHTNNDVLRYLNGEWVNTAFTLNNIITNSGNLTTQYLIVSNATGVLSTGGFTATAGNINASSGSIIASGYVQGTASASAPGIQGLTSTADNPGLLGKSSIANPNSDATVGLELQLATLNQTDNEFIPSISFTARDSSNDLFEAANIYTYVTDVSAGTEDAMLCIKTVEAGTVQIAAEFNGGMKVYNHAEDGQPNNDFVIYNPTSTPATDDATGQITMRGKNNANQDVDYVSWIGGAQDITDGSEDGAAIFQVMKAGTLTEVLEFSYQTGINFYSGLYSFPQSAPTAGQVLGAGSVDPEELEWVSAGGSGNSTFRFEKTCYNSVTTSTDQYYWLPGSSTYGFEFYDNNELSSLGTNGVWNRYKKLSHRLVSGTYDLDFLVDISMSNSTSGTSHSSDYAGQDVDIIIYKVGRDGNNGNVTLTQLGTTQSNTQDATDTARGTESSFSINGEVFDGEERIMVVLKGTVNQGGTRYAHWVYDIHAEKTA